MLRHVTFSSEASWRLVGSTDEIRANERGDSTTRNVFRCEGADLTGRPSEESRSEEDAASEHMPRTGLMEGLY